MATPLSVKYEQEVNEYRNMEKELNNLTSNRSQLMTQLNENEMVKRELDLLTADSTVYKMIGPVLIKQDRSEAQSNVGKRIDFINAELYVDGGFSVTLPNDFNHVVGVMKPIGRV